MSIRLSHRVGLADGVEVSGDKDEIDFIYKRVQALQEFFNAIDSLTRAVVRLESLGLSNVKNILSILK